MLQNKTVTGPIEINNKSPMTKLNILYESENFVVVDKPADFLINSDDENEKNTLHQFLVAQMSHSQKLKHGFHFIHRLDYATSGVICLGRNKTASAEAGKLFESRQVDKYYLAIVRGHMKDECTIIHNQIGYDKSYLNTNKKMCGNGINCEKPKEAITKIMILEKGYYDGEPATKIIMKPLTGRRHQLRLHCHQLGHNIVGDFTYSDEKDVDPPRMYLHAYRLTVPVPNENITVVAEDPFTSTDGTLRDWFSEVVINSMEDERSVLEKIDNFQCDPLTK